MKKNRMTYLDMAKGIGILFMIVGHTISLGWQKDLIYSFHMPLFFVCSGMTMVLSNNWLEWREAAKKSAKRLLLPALVLFMVMTLWTYLVEGQFDAAYTKDFALNRLASLLLASGSDVLVFGKEVAAIGLLWFLPALFFARLLLDALHLLMPKKWESLVLLAWALVLILHLPLPLALDLGLAGMGFVDIGIWLRERLPQWEQEGKKKIATGDKALIGAGIFWFLAFLLQEKSAVPAFDMAQRDYGITFLGLAMAACGSLSLILLCRKLEKYVRADGFLATCGRYSMLLLSIHYLGYLPYLYYGSLFPMGVVRCLFRLVLEVCFSFFLILWKKKKEMQQEVWWSRLAFLAVFLLQMNYLLFCRFPGGLQYDSINQLTQVVTGQYSNHHPIYHTLWLTLGAKLAEILGGDLTLGVFFFTVMQVLVFSYMVSYLLKTLQQIGIRQRYLGIILGYFLVFPYHLFFAAYVNEENPMIDQLLREALNTRIVNRFLGYQSKAKGVVDKQVYALWNILQKRKFRYSSVSNTSLSSNVVFSQRVRTFDDALDSSQINCVDGSVLFASLLRSINIDPILVRTPGHMFVGYYTDNSHKDMNFLETTMIGDVDLDDFFPDEQLDSTMVGKSQNEMSLLTFEKSKQYANKKYKENEEGIHSGKLNYMFLEISKEVRRKIQPIGK